MTTGISPRARARAKIRRDFEVPNDSDRFSLKAFCLSPLGGLNLDFQITFCFILSGFLLNLLALANFLR
jgi:hypothetical protein